jgi:hypothetical protein
MRSFIQHREALLVNCDLVRHRRSRWEAAETIRGVIQLQAAMSTRLLGYASEAVVRSMASAEWDELFGNVMTVMVESSAIVSRKPLKNSNGGEAGHDTWKSVAVTNQC